MQVTETLSDGLKRAFTVVVPAADIESRRAKRLSDLGKDLRLPGFRPGKVPMTVVKQRFGTAVQAEILEETVQSATDQVLSDRGLRPAQQPKVEVVNVEPTADLEFKVEVELLPDVTLPDFSTIEIDRPRAEPTPEMLDTAVGEIAKRNRELEPVDPPRPSEPGDVLTVDFVGKVDGAPFQGGTANDVDVEVGGDGFIPGFTEQLAGLSVGDHRTIDVTFPDQYAEATLAGKAATFDITVKGHKHGTVPAADDAFAEKLGVGSLERLRSLVAQNFQREYDQLTRLRVKRQLLDALSSLSTFPVPEGMVETEFAQIWQRVEADRAQGQVDSDDAGKDDATLRAEYRAIAERRVRLGLLLAEIGRQNGIVVQPDEMTRAMRAEAGRYPGQEQQVMEFFRKNPQAAETLRGPLFEEKVVDYVLELARVTDRPVSPEQLAREANEVSGNAEARSTTGDAAGQTTGAAA